MNERKPAIEVPNFGTNLVCHSTLAINGKHLQAYPRIINTGLGFELIDLYNIEVFLYREETTIAEVYLVNTIEPCPFTPESEEYLNRVILLKLALSCYGISSEETMAFIRAIQTYYRSINN